MLVYDAYLIFVSISYLLSNERIRYSESVRLRGNIEAITWGWDNHFRFQVIDSSIDVSHLDLISAYIELLRTIFESSKVDLDGLPIPTEADIQFNELLDSKVIIWVDLTKVISKGCIKIPNFNCFSIPYDLYNYKDLLTRRGSAEFLEPVRSKYYFDKLTYDISCLASKFLKKVIFSIFNSLSCFILAT